MVLVKIHFKYSFCISANKNIQLKNNNKYLYGISKKHDEQDIFKRLDSRNHFN